MKAMLKASLQVSVLHLSEATDDHLSEVISKNTHCEYADDS